MTQYCYKTHREDPQTFPKIDAVATSQLLRWNTKGRSNKYPMQRGKLSSIKNLAPKGSDTQYRSQNKQVLASTI